MSKKEKKDKKKENKSSSFFSNLNTDSTIEYGYAEKNPKSKWAKWIIAALVLGATAIGITVPWVMSSCTLSISKAYSDSRVMYTYKDPITGKDVSVTWEEFSNRVQAIKPSSSTFDKWDEVFYSSVLKDLYNEERDAFLQFKAIYKKLHGQEPTVTNFGTDLSSSYDDIRKEQRKILEDNKKNFQKAVDSSSWIDSWISELQSNSIYGPQSSEIGTNVTQLENKAVDYMVSNKIKSGALARFSETSIQTTNWTYKDLEFARENPIDTNIWVTWKNSEGIKKSLTRKEASKIWRMYLIDIKEDASGIIDTSVNGNVRVYKNDKSKIAVFENKSFIPKYRNPLNSNELIDLLNKNWNFGLISSFTFPITPGESNTQPFSFDKSNFLKLFTIQNLASSTAGNFVPFSQLSKFQGANNVNGSLLVQNIDQAKDQMLINTFNSSSNDSSDSDSSSSSNNNLGTSKLLSTTDLLKASSSDDSSDSSSDSDSSLNMFYIAALSATNAGASSTDPSQTLFSINQTNPFTTFMEIFLSLASNATPNWGLATYASNNWDKLFYGDKTASPEVVALSKLLKDNLTSTYEFNENGPLNARQFNDQLAVVVENLSENDSVYLGRILNCIMIGDNTNTKLDYTSNVSSSEVGYWTLYKLSDTTFAYISSSEIKIFSRGMSEPTKEDFIKMVASDLTQTVSSSTSTLSDDDSSDSSSTNLYYDVASVFNKLNNDYLIIENLLQESSNQQKFKDGLNEYLQDNENQIKKTVDEIYNSFVKTVDVQLDSLFNTEIGSILSNVSSSLETLINENRCYDFGIIKDVNGEKVSVFQTQSKTNENAVAKGKETIDQLFINNLEIILSSRMSAQIRKGGK